METQQSPTPDEVRQALANFDARQQKIVAGMLTVMMREPTQVREREWIAEQLTQMTLLAGDFEVDTPHEGVQAVQDYLATHANELLQASYLLFQRVGLDFAPRVSEGFTFDEALARGLEYLPSIEAAPQAETEGEAHAEDEGEAKAQTAPSATRIKSERDLGEQPLARLMAERDLRPADLVAASDEQITHKMVTRALKGRRLTANTMGKVVRAWEKISGNAVQQGELFNYKP